MSKLAIAVVGTKPRFARNNLSLAIIHPFFELRVQYNLIPAYDLMLHSFLPERRLPELWFADPLTVFAAWIYGHLQPHAAALKVAKVAVCSRAARMPSLVAGP